MCRSTLGAAPDRHPHADPHHHRDPHRDHHHDPDPHPQPQSHGQPDRHRHRRPNHNQHPLAHPDLLRDPDGSQGRGKCGCRPQGGGIAPSSKPAPPRNCSQETVSVPISRLVIRGSCQKPWCFGLSVESFPGRGYISVPRSVCACVCRCAHARMKLTVFAVLIPH